MMPLRKLSLFFIIPKTFFAQRTVLNEMLPNVQSSLCPRVLLVFCFFRSSEFFFYPLLARLDIGAGVEQPFGCLIVQNLQSVLYVVESMDWTL